MKTENKDKYYRGNVADFSETKGYLIGRFMGEKGFPLLETDEVEVAWKKLPAGSCNEKPHFHRKGVEITIVIAGRCRLEIDGKEISLSKGDFLVIYPETRLQNRATEEGTEVIVVKAPSAPQDKFEV